ncbi:uncharacterized protein E0L32_012121 [Thyridium curvatum]|uniref:Zn(2)-C6 fungal-type domain-containing protein n=1 Tax=Thyridium curvatum TaxID=1093900 RepID=A0A507BCG1_9PEZI|nr:uncharacterized protein E0L32_012121 [Thyridium curvatum]TPX17587.1 hypothetical protein E0L32_012121 [Thyridium curvatum]
MDHGVILGEPDGDPYLDHGVTRRDPSRWITVLQGDPACPAVAAADSVTRCPPPRSTSRRPKAVLKTHLPGTGTSTVGVKLSPRFFWRPSDNMSSGRVEKRKSKKTIQRASLVALIESCGMEVKECSFCARHKLKCVMMEGNSRCNHCVRRGRSCDNAPLGPSASRLLSEKRRLEAAEKTTEAELLEAQRLLNEKLARLMRLRMQKESLISRGKEMVRRGLEDLDALDEVERRESDAVLEVQSSGGFDVIDWGTVGLGGGQLLTGLDFAGETVEASAGNASSVP